MKKINAESGYNLVKGRQSFYVWFRFRDWMILHLAIV